MQVVSSRIVIEEDREIFLGLVTKISERHHYHCYIRRTPRPYLCYCLTGSSYLYSLIPTGSKRIQSHVALITFNCSKQSFPRNLKAS